MKQQLLNVQNVKMAIIMMLQKMSVLKTKMNSKLIVVCNFMWNILEIIEKTIVYLVIIKKMDQYWHFMIHVQDLNYIVYIV